MKKYFILFALSLISLNLSAQTWFVDGERWQYEWWVFGPEFGFEELVVDGDTLIEGQQYKKIHLRRISWNHQYPSNPPLEFSLDIPVYELDDKVYYREDNTGAVNLLYDFNAEAGDQIPLANGCEGDYYEVLETGTVDMNGQLRRYQDVVYEVDPVSFFNFRIIEGIGATDRYFFLNRVLSCYPDYPVWGLMCYSYEDFEYNPEGLQCDALEFLIIATDEPSLEGVVKIYPTLFRETLYIEKLQQTNLRQINVYKTDGRRVFHSQEESTSLHLAHLPPGMYFVELISDEGARLVQRVIRQE